MRSDSERQSSLQKLVDKMSERDDQSESTDSGPTSEEIAEHLRNRKGR